MTSNHGATKADIEPAGEATSGHVTTPPRSGAASTLGLRERHKLDKLRRITAAAESLFSAKGYDSTTLREIAHEAGIALGTIALYASDKRDLILLLFNKNIPPLMELGRKRADPKNRLAENTTSYFTPMYLAFSRNVRLYRIILNYGDLAGYGTARTQEFDRTRVVILDDLGKFILWARDSGECTPAGDLGLQAKSFFYLYFTAVRRWIAEPEPDAEAGLQELKALYDLHVIGLMQRS